MESEARKNKNVDWSRFGLGTETSARARANTSGFVDLGNEYDYGAGGHQASGVNELFAEEQVYNFNIILNYIVKTKFY